MANLSFAQTLNWKARISYRTFFIALSAGLVFLLPWLSRDFGITWDEWMDSNNGLLALRYVLSLGRDKEVLNFWHGIYYPHFFYSVVGMAYGLLFNALSAVLQNGLHTDTHLIRFYTTSHAINALFGAVAMVYTGLLAKRLAGWRAGCLALILIAVSPRFFGNAMNNPKDIPFAAAGIFFLYYLTVFLQEQPQPRKRTCLLLACGIAASLGTRAGGLIQMAYLFLFSAWLVFEARFLKTGLALSLPRLTLTVALIAIAGYLGGLLFWPYGWENPIAHPLKALHEVSRISFWEGLIVFEGHSFSAKVLPWYYIPKWILISSPLAVIGGLLFLLLLWRPVLKNTGSRLAGPLLFAAIFPVAYVIYQKSVLLDSWRHLLFVYPPWVVLSVLGWEAVLREVNSTGKRLFVAAILILQIAQPFSWMIRNHPHAYVYFNPLVGGINGAFARYETDYWGNSLRGCAEWLAAYHQQNSPLQPAYVRADGSVMSSYPFLKQALGDFYRPYGYPPEFLAKDPYFFIQYAPYMGGDQSWNYALVLSRGWKPEILRSAAWPPEGTIHEIQADDVTLCAVVKNPRTTLHV